MVDDREGKFPRGISSYNMQEYGSVQTYVWHSQQGIQVVKSQSCRSKSTLTSGLPD